MGAPLPQLCRRRFLRWASASAAFFAVHPCGASENPRPDVLPKDPEQTSSRILSLELLSSASVAKMKEFYHASLGLRVVDEKAQRITIAAGATHLTFVQAAANGEKPFYHFAFNIPENKLLDARTWQLERTALLPIPKRLRDPNYPDDVVDYRHWNAHSIFFLDPAGNVVEYIARHDLKNAARGEFGSADILYASEIGLTVDDVSKTALKLKEVFDLSQYRGGSDEFLALGDVHGLVLVIKRGRILSFDAAEKKAASVFRTVARLRGNKQTQYAVPAFPYELFV